MSEYDDLLRDLLVERFRVHRPERDNNCDDQRRVVSGGTREGRATSETRSRRAQGGVRRDLPTYGPPDVGGFR